MLEVDRFSPKWIHQVLRDRGIPCPGVSAISHFLDRVAAGDPEEYAFIGEAATRLAQGSDNHLDFAFLARCFRHVETADLTGPAAPVNQAKPLRQELTQSYRSAFNKCHVYGKAFALTVEQSLWQTLNPVNGGSHTISIEGAKAVPSQGDGARTYDWSQKIVFQLTWRELPTFTAFLLLGTESQQIAFANHGPANNKSLSLEIQKGKIYCKLQEGKKVIAVPVEAADVFAMSDLSLQCLVRNSPALDSTLLMMSLRRLANALAAPA